MGSRGKYKTWCGIADRIGWASFPFICGSLYWKLHSPRGGTDHCSSECRYDTFNASWVEAPYHYNYYYVNYFTVHSSFVNSVLVYTSDVWLSHACITHSHRSPENEWQIRSECQTTDTPAAYIQTYGGRDAALANKVCELQGISSLTLYLHAEICLLNWWRIHEHTKTIWLICGHSILFTVMSDASYTSIADTSRPSPACGLPWGSGATNGHYITCNNRRASSSD